MVNNFTNINKENNHLGLSPQIIIKKNTTYDVGNPGPWMEQAQTRGRIKLFKMDPKLPRNGIGGVMVSVFALSAVDCGFEPPSSQTKDYKIDICCFAAKYAA
jgi:hypothetical protein